MILLYKFILILCLSLTSIAFAAEENLDEMIDVRKARQRVNTFYSGETGSAYTWQPQTLMYTDVTTGHEVWRMSSTPSVRTQYHSDIHWASWSADGKYVAYATAMSDALSYNTGAFAGEDGYRVWFTPRTDGSYLKPIITGPTRVDNHNLFFTWSPVIPGEYYAFGRTYAGNTGLNSNYLYTGTITDTSTSYEFAIDFPGTTELQILKTISGDGLKIVATEWSEDNLYPATVHPTPVLDDLDGYAIALNVDTYWGDTITPIPSWHDQTMGGYAGNYWLYFLPGGDHTWWRMRLTGTGTSGAPHHTADITAPYSWGGELEPANCAFTGNNPFSGTNYWSHGTIDRWGRFAIFSHTNVTPISPGVEDTEDHVIDQSTYGLGGTQHHDYKAWSDYFVSTRGSDAGDYSIDFIATMKHNAGATSVETVVYTHDLFNNNGVYFGSDYEYHSLPRPAQSPDGTKVSFSSTLLNTKTGSYDDEPDVYWAAAYFPYPPEIISVSSGVVRFDWRTDQTTSRGYTQRGWPDETTDDPPAPRETKEFRLWKSANGTTGWVPVGTVTANPFDKFDYVDGGLKSGQVAYWEITDPSPSGYYAVTSVEWSGLESRTLSNVFSAEGSQTAAYPASPGADADITSSYNSDLYRYTDIIADDDGAVPTDTQQMRIASIAGNPSSYVDWLGKSDDTTQYRFVYVDTQGNRSSIMTPTVQTDTPNAGQYTLTDMAYDDGTNNGSVSVGTGTTWQVTETGPSVMIQAN